MKGLLQETIKWQQFELLIDTQIFSKDIALKAAYNFLNLWYFFFKLDHEKNLILQFTTKEGIDMLPQEIIWKYADEILDVYLRDKLEKDNKIIRETIVKKALLWPVDSQNFVSLDTDEKDDTNGQNEIDFDKDIDEILKEIENDPDLKLGDDDINAVLEEMDKPKITVDPNAISSAKNMFNK